MSPRSFLVILLALCTVSAHGAGRGNCPVLPSGKCWADCSKAQHELICEEAEWFTLHRDLDHYAKEVGNGPSLELTIWNSPKITNVDHNLLSPVLQKMDTLILGNLPNLRFFPNVNGASRLKTLMIEGCPSLKDIDTSLLPVNIGRVDIQSTNITRLDYRMVSGLSFPSLTQFTFNKNYLQGVRGTFFQQFPKLTALSINENVVKVPFDEDDKSFSTVLPLQQLNFNGNDFRGVPNALNTRIFISLMNSVVVNKTSKIDLHNNNFVIDQASLSTIGKLREVESLSLRGNNFISSASIANFFKNAGFDNLKILDVGDSKFPRQTGVFAGLPSLQILRADLNNFRDISTVNLFQGSESKALWMLELENNLLPKMLSPLQTSVFAGSLVTLNLNNNPIEFPADVASMTSLLSSYSNLKLLDLKGTGMTTFDSRMVQSLSKMTSLDLSCNAFSRIDASFFSNLPQTLTFLNLTFCSAVANSDSAAVVVVEDAFTTMKKIFTLHLSGGFLRDDIFRKLNKMQADSKGALRDLFLDSNGIRYFNLSTLAFSGFSLRKLSLRNNQIQTISFSEFSDPSWQSLEILDLSDNLLTVVRESNFRGLDNLKTLHLNGNKLIHIYDGAMDSLGNMQNLYLQDNLLRRFPPIFTKENTKLETLGLERNPLHSLHKSSFTNLKRLDRLLMHETPMRYIEHGVLDTLTANNFRVSFPTDSLHCSCNNTWIKDYVNRLEVDHFATIVFEDLENLSSYHITHVPHCRFSDHSTAFITENFECEKH